MKSDGNVIMHEKGEFLDTLCIRKESICIHKEGTFGEGKFVYMGAFVCTCKGVFVYMGRGKLYTCLWGGHLHTCGGGICINRRGGICIYGRGA